MATLSSHKSPSPVTKTAAELSTEAPSTTVPSKKPEPTTSIPVTPIKPAIPATPVKPVTPTPTPAPKKVKVTQASYFVSVDGCLHPLS